MASQYIVLSANPRYAGVVSATIEGRTATVAVLPKFWSPDRYQSHTEPRARIVWKHGKQHQVFRLMLFENQECIIEFQDAKDDQDPRILAVRDLLEKSKNKAAKIHDWWLRQHKDPEKNGKDKKAHQLISEGVNATSTNFAAANDAAQFAPDSLYRLMLLNWRQRPSDAVEVARDHVQDPMLLPVIHQLLCHEVKQNLRWIRRGYVQREEELSTVRGRVAAQSLVRSIQTGQPTILCRYEEFTEETPLFRVIATALDVVASGTKWEDRYGKLNRGQLPRHAGLELRRYLGSIPSLAGPRMALGVADQLRLSPMNRRWAKALRLSRMVLRGTVPDKAIDGLSLTPGIWTLDTATTWERLLQQAARDNGREAKHLDRIAGPFSKISGDRVLDLVFDEWIIDAKYKRFSGRPNRDDQHQMYVYGHVRDVPTQYVVLVYPDGTGEPKQPWLGGYARLHQGFLGPQPLPLRMYGWNMPFPTAEDVQTEETWGHYQAQLNERFRDHLAKPGGPAEK